MRAAGLAAGLLLLLAPNLGLCQSLAKAESFAHRLYDAYARGMPDYLGPQARRVFSPRLLSLIRRDERLAPAGEPGALDGDPICDCQDPGGMTRVRIEVLDAGPGRARAHVRFLLNTEPRDVTLELVAVQRRWRVDDVRTADTPSLAEMLLKAHPEGQRRPQR